MFKNKVGMSTGDATINIGSPCLVMTTEVLRNLLYMDHDVIRDTAYIIFDEVHYINDATRGSVWEEVIILLPKEICLVMLSATVPNYFYFASWIARIKEKPIFIHRTL